MPQDRPTLDFWYEFASNYSWLSAMRIGALSEASGIDIRWRPFLLGPIFKAQGWSDSPFNIYPAKGRHMRRDMDRQTAAYGLTMTWPARFPANSILATRVALAAGEAGFLEDYSRAVYSAEFSAGRDIADREVIAEIIAGCGHDPASLLDRAADDEIKGRLRAETDEAQRLGIFGAPSFVTADGELFWGDDRLEQALAWASLHRRRS